MNNKSQDEGVGRVWSQTPFWRAASQPTNVPTILLSNGTLTCKHTYI